MYSLPYLYFYYFSSWLKKEVKMNSYLTGLVAFGVLVLFKNTNGETQCDDDNSIRSCDGSYKSGNYIYMNLNSPCACTVNALFSGELLVTVFKDVSYQCRTEVTVTAGTTAAVFHCTLPYPTSISFNVNTNETVVNVKTYYTTGYTSGNFSYCLGINQKTGGELGGNLIVTCGHSTTNTESTTPTTATSTIYGTTTEVDSSPQKSAYASSDSVKYIIAGGAGGIIVLVVVVIVLVAIIVLRKKKGGKNKQTQKTEKAFEHTNKVFDENYDLPDNPLYHSAQPMDEVGYSSVQNNQLGLPPTEATNTKENDPNYDVPTNNRPINDSDTSPMPIYAVPNKSRASAHEENEPQAMYAQVSKPSKSTTQGPMQSTNQDGLVYLEVEKDAISVNENSPYTKNENKDSVSYAKIKRN